MRFELNEEQVQEAVTKAAVGDLKQGELYALIQPAMKVVQRGLELAAVDMMAGILVEARAARPGSYLGCSEREKLHAIARAELAAQCGLKLIPDVPEENAGPEDVEYPSMNAPSGLAIADPNPGSLLASAAPAGSLGGHQ